MQAVCEKCGTKHVLDEHHLGGHTRVRFHCTKCGHSNEVNLSKHPDRTASTSPLPSFATTEAAPYVEPTALGEQAGLALPADKMICLTVVQGPSKGLVYTLDRPRVVLGRLGADMALDDSQVSRWHCAIEVKNEVIFLRDLESTNGTYFEEERVRAADLKHQSEFRIGASRIRLTITPK